LRNSVADDKLSFRQRAKAKDEFRKRFKQNKWTYVWSMVATYSLIMVLVLAMLYFNAPEEHCYYDSNLKAPLAIADSTGNITSPDQALKLLLILKVGLIVHSYGLLASVACIFQPRCTNKTYRGVALGAMCVYVGFWALYIIWMAKGRWNATMGVCCGDFTTACINSHNDLYTCELGNTINSVIILIACLGAVVACGGFMGTCYEKH
jgi:hypothetical protein